MQIGDSPLTIEWLAAGLEDRFRAGGPLSVERRMARAGGEVCPKSKVFGVGGVGKETEKEPKRPEKLKLFARICG